MDRTPSSSNPSCSPISQGEANGTDPSRLIDPVHRRIWGHFIDAHGVLLDYVDDDGSVEIPSPEDCERGYPNAIGWRLPISNGAFFNGLYLPALCERHRRTGDPAAARKAARLAAGLMHLSEVSEAPGFIARGTGTDGICHYPTGSDDQTHPWFLGLHAYLRSGIPARPERERIIGKMLEVASVLERSGWECPCDGIFKGETRGGYAGGDFRGAARLLYLLRLMHEISADRAWLEKYRGALRGFPEESPIDRLAICGRGMLHDEASIPGVRKQQWIFAGSQASLLELARMEDDPAVRRSFLLGLGANAKVAFDSIRDGLDFPSDASVPYRLGKWRSAFPDWRPQTSQQDAAALADEQLSAFHRVDSAQGRESRMSLEQHRVREPLAAAFVCRLGAPEALRPALGAQLGELLRQYPWDSIHTSTIFFAECAYYATP
jgi:hypothetical protein